MRKTAIIDIGSAPMDGPPVWEHMLDAGRCSVIGFEPQPEMLAQLLITAGPNESYRPDVIADGKTHTLRIAKYPGMTSLLEVDQTVLGLFQRLSEGAQIVRAKGVQTSRLDDVVIPEQCDFLRMDVQGSEAMILDNAHETLKHAVAVQLEMSWLPVYIGQLDIGRMDTKLRDLGFIPHKCVGVRNWALTGTTQQDSQLVEGDFTYIRDLRSDLAEEQLYHLGQLAWYVFKSGDLNAHCAERLKQMRKAA